MLKKRVDKIFKLLNDLTLPEKKLVIENVLMVYNTFDDDHKRQAWEQLKASHTK